MCRWDNKLPGSYGHCAMCLTNTLLLYISYLHQFWLGTRFPNISGRLWIQCFWIFILGTTNHVIKVVMLSLVSTVHQLIAYKMICVLFQIKTGLLGLEGCKVNNWRNTFYFLFFFFFGRSCFPFTCFCCIFILRLSSCIFAQGHAFFCCVGYFPRCSTMQWGASQV